MPDELAEPLLSGGRPALAALWAAAADRLARPPVRRAGARSRSGGCGWCLVVSREQCSRGEGVGQATGVGGGSAEAAVSV